MACFYADLSHYDQSNSRVFRLCLHRCFYRFNRLRSTRKIPSFAMHSKYVTFCLYFHTKVPLMITFCNFSQGTGFEKKIRPCYDFTTKKVIGPNECNNEENAHCCLYNCACVLKGGMILFNINISYCGLALTTLFRFSWIQISWNSKTVCIALE